MKRYDSYKDSGVEWIGEVPEHWEIRPLKHLSKITLGKMLTPEDKGGYTLKPYLRSQNIQINQVDISDIKKMWFSENELGKYRLKKGDILVNEGGDIGRTCIWNSEIDECYIQNSVNRVQMVLGDNHYYLYHFYLHHQLRYFDSIVNRVSIPHLTKEKLENVLFVAPLLAEQIQIAKYLDQKTTQIDKLIADKQKLIALLNEERTTMINQAVTKGLNPNVPMKDSGVEWLGEIPKPWKIGKLKIFCELITDGSHFSPLSLESGKRYISVKDVKENTIDFENCKYISEDDFLILERNGCRPKENDILLTKDGTIGRASIVQEDNDFVILSSLAIIRAKLKFIKPLYLKHFLVSQINIEQMLSSLQGSALTRITLSIINNLYIIVPQINEQEKILDYIKKHSDNNDKLVLKVQQEIELLKEYKTALISEAVTGKIDVQDEIIRGHPERVSAPALL